MVRRLFFLALIAASGIASASAYSDFEADADGWLGVNVAFPSLEVLGTANPTWTGHSITVTEQGSGLFVLAAPSKFLGNQSICLGGIVTFQLSDTVADGVPYPGLLLRGNGTILYYETPAPGTTLTDFMVELTPTGWKNGTGAQATQAEFNSVFSNLDVFAINADWKTGGTDSVELDNVMMLAPVPEPMTVPVLGIGAAWTATRRRKKG